MQQDLVYGYIKQEIVKENDNIYPLELNSVISEFLGNIFFKFDVCEDEDYRDWIQDNGKCIKAKTGLTNSFGSSFCIAKDITIINIKCKNPSATNAVIGITSNIEESVKEGWISYAKGYKYWWYNGCAIFAEKDFKTIGKEIHTVEHWKSDDIITIEINRKRGDITWYLNNEEKCKMPLETSVTYYLWVCVCGLDAEYRLL